MLTWNRVNFLPISLQKLIDSITDINNCQIIVLDNNSDDSTWDILQDFKTKYPFLEIIRNNKHTGLNAYKKLFLKAKGKYIIEVDDDVIEFPENSHNIFESYFEDFPNYGYLAMNVVQNEHTHGGVIDDGRYKYDKRNDKTVMEGPTGGWFSAFKKKNFYHPNFFIHFMLLNFSFKNGEDGFINHKMKKIGLKSGVIKDYKCFHAQGPYYSNLFNCLERDMYKYEVVGRKDRVNLYKDLKNE